MRRFLYNFLWSTCALVVLNCCDTESNVDPAYKNYFIKYYGGDGHQEAKDFVVNADGTVVMIGTWNGTTGPKKVYIVKADAEGNVLWEKILESDNDEVVADVELITAGLDAGNLVVISNYRKNSLDSMAIRLTVISQDGDSLRGALFNRYRSQLASSVTPLSNSGFYISGKTTDPADNPSPGAETQDNTLIIKLENDFTYSPAEVTRVIGYYIGSAIKVFQTSSQFYYCGYSDRKEDVNPGETSNFFFRTFTDNPGLVTSTYLGANDEDEIMVGIAQSPIGQFMSVGTTVNSNSKVMIAARVSSNFQTTSQMQNILSNAEGVAVAPSGVSDFFLLGNVIGTGGNRDILIKKVDFAFGGLMSLQFGSPNNDDTGSAIAELPNGDILILGTMELVNQKKMALIKVKANGSF